MARFQRRRVNTDDGSALEATVGMGERRFSSRDAYGKSERFGGPTQFGLGGVLVTIDTREIEQMRLALLETGQGLKRDDRIVVSALNRGMDRLNTGLKRSLRTWTGIRRARDVDARLKKQPASGGKWQSSVRVQSPWTRIDSQFSARSLKRSRGVSHRAWNRRQVAKGAFMLPGSDVAVKRVGKGRWAIKRLYGPNLAREMERHSPIVRAMTVRAAEKYVIPSLKALVQVHLAKQKAARGL